MQKSFVVKATLCIEESQFYLRAGDVLMYESVAHRLTVYRANEIIKTMKQTPLGIAAMLKTGILAEVAAPSPVVVAAPTAPSPVVAAVQPAVHPVKPNEEEKRVKRGKAQPKEIRTEDVPRLKEVLAKFPKKTEEQLDAVVDLVRDNP